MELRQIVNVIVKWWWLIAVSVIVASISSYFGTKATPYTYQARTTLMVGQVLQNPNPNSADLYTGQVLAQSYSDLAGREPVLQATLTALGLDWDWAVLQQMVIGRVIPGTQLLEISVIDNDPRRAKILVEEVAHQLILQSPSAADPEKEAERQFILTQIEELKQNIKDAAAEIRQLDSVITGATSARQIQDARTRQSALQTQITTWQATYADLLSNLQEGTPNFLSVMEPAQLPTQPVGPRIADNVLLAAAIGLALSGSAAFLLEYLDDTLKTSEDVRSHLNMTVLGAIYRIQGKEYPNKLITLKHPRSPTSEAYRVLRTNLQFSAIEHPLRTLMVTSSNPLEGKSVTAANLAAIMAQAGKRVALVDADMRRPTQHHIFEMSNSVGLTTALLDANADLAFVLRPTQIENLKLMTSGPLPPNPSELLGSKRMGKLIEVLLEHADIVIFDAPPLMAVADPTVMAARVDGTLLVVCAGKTRRAMAKRSMEALAAAGAYVPGVVLNRLAARGVGYYHYYAEDNQPRRFSLRSLPRMFSRNGHAPVAPSSDRVDVPKPTTNVSQKPVSSDS